jgi:multidrug efflux pump subunit AcrA (membrane-fusion protein)
MGLTNLRLVAAVVLAAGVIGVGAGEATYRTLAAGRPNADGDGAAAPSRADRRERVEVPSRRDGTLLVVGTEIKPGEDVPPDQAMVIKVGDEQVKCRRLKEGDMVEEGQLLARVDDTLAREEVATKKAAVDAAKAEWDASVKARDEAWERYMTCDRCYRGGIGTVSLEELRAAKLAYERYHFEEISKKTAITKAEAELRQAQTLLRMHEIHSPVGGVVRDIYRNRGEAVRALEPVVQIRIVDKGEE